MTLKQRARMVQFVSRCQYLYTQNNTFTNNNLIGATEDKTFQTNGFYIKLILVRFRFEKARLSARTICRLWKWYIHHIYIYLYPHVIALHKISKYYANRNLIAVGVLLMLSGNAGIILGMGSANERRRYIVTSSLTVWTHTQDNPWECVHRNCWYCWVINHSWRHHVMKTLSAFLVRNSPVTAGFPSQTPSNALLSCFLVNVIKLQSCRLCNITLMDFRCDPVYLLIYLFIIYFVFIYFKIKKISSRGTTYRDAGPFIFAFRIIHRVEFGWWKENEHDDVMTWKRFPHYWPFVRGINRWPVLPLVKGRWCGSLVFNLLSAWVSCWTNGRITFLWHHSL